MVSYVKTEIETLAPFTKNPKGDPAHIEFRISYVGGGKRVFVTAYNIDRVVVCEFELALDDLSDSVDLLNKFADQWKQRVDHEQ